MLYDHKNLNMHYLIAPRIENHKILNEFLKLDKKILVENLYLLIPKI